ncbi:hypothetical protein M378DRAFT_159369 [Amanita muscaria Koide BX008]|uniref:Uncharacterized protein n=1 Tax=Amanita muscaria (strain Koide BX008) TaxID=946122 RepID=A0A0C2XDN1_AMAMK|nr:hypothetical protein M378DRAFT_159369 [Amanita muscaria Koide BX008]
MSWLVKSLTAVTRVQMRHPIGNLFALSDGNYNLNSSSDILRKYHRREITLNGALRLIPIHL